MTAEEYLKTHPIYHWYLFEKQIETKYNKFHKSKYTWMWTDGATINDSTLTTDFGENIVTYYQHCFWEFTVPVEYKIVDQLTIEEAYRKHGFIPDVTDNNFQDFPENIQEAIKLVYAQANVDTLITIKSMSKKHLEAFVYQIAHSSPTVINYIDLREFECLYEKTYK